MLKFEIWLIITDNIQKSNGVSEIEQNIFYNFPFYNITPQWKGWVSKFIESGIGHFKKKQLQDIFASNYLSEGIDGNYQVITLFSLW